MVPLPHLPAAGDSGLTRIPAAPTWSPPVVAGSISTSSYLRL